MKNSEKIEWYKGDIDAILHRVVTEIFVEKVTFKPRPEGGDSVSSGKLRPEHSR